MALQKLEGNIVFDSWVADGRKGTNESLDESSFGFAADSTG